MPEKSLCFFFFFLFFLLCKIESIAASDRRWPRAHWCASTSGGMRRRRMQWQSAECGQKFEMEVFDSTLGAPRRARSIQTTTAADKSDSDLRKVISTSEWDNWDMLPTSSHRHSTTTEPETMRSTTKIESLSQRFWFIWLLWLASSPIRRAEPIRERGAEHANKSILKPFSVCMK